MVQEAASDLRMELYGLLPRKLKDLTISGSGFNRLADGILDVRRELQKLRESKDFFLGNSSFIASFNAPQYDVERIAEEHV